MTTGHGGQLPQTDGPAGYAGQVVRRQRQRIAPGPLTVVQPPGRFRPGPERQASALRQTQRPEQTLEQLAPPHGGAGTYAESQHHARSVLGSLGALLTHQLAARCRW